MCVAVQECALLLESLAEIKRRHPCYRICSYQLADLAACLALRASRLSNEQLMPVACAAASFEWPTYQSLLPVLNAVCREAIARERGPAAAAMEGVLAAAVRSAGAMRARLGNELQARFADWRQEAVEEAAESAVKSA